MALRHDVPAFEKQAADLVGQGGALTDKAIAHPVQCLDVELLLALEFDKAHGRTGGGFGNRLGIPVVILLHLDVGAHILRRHQPNLMTQRCQRTSHVMGAATRLHRHRAGRQPGGKGDDPVTTHPPSDDDLAASVQSDDAAAVLAQIDAQDHNAHSPLLPPMNTDILYGGRREGRAIQ